MPSFLNYENYLTLIDRINREKNEDSVEDADSIKSAVESFIGYVREVCMSETRTKLAYGQYEGSELRDLVETYDKTRTRAHEAAIANVGMINKIAEFYGVGPVFTGNVHERLEVAAFCMEITEKIFLNRKL